MPPNKARPTDLTINLKSAAEAAQSSAGPNSSPINLEGVDLSSFGGDIGLGSSASPPSLPPLPQSPPSSPRHNREPSKNILRHLGSKSSKVEQETSRAPARQVKAENDVYRSTTSGVAAVYQLKKNVGSSPELSLVGSMENIGVNPSEANDTADTARRPQQVPHHSEDSAASKKSSLPFRKQLGRTKSTRSSSNGSKTRPEIPEARTAIEPAPRTAPLPAEQRSEMLRAKKDKDKSRGKSADRAGASESDDNAVVPPARPVTKERESHKDKEKEKSGFMSSSKHAVSKTTKASGNFLTRLGKIGRSSSNNEKEVPDSEYVLKVINLPLVEQTRLTRISKDLSSCRDKTEYWMPSLPWRCIDYLNLNCEAEGLYRVPGSGPQVKRWQRRFDTEMDVDLLDENELYDPNNIGSMLKSWLRDLPTEIMPNHRQLALGVELEKENPDYAKIGQPAPQKLRDALSELSPFNYYLLFAITCHLSLLLSHKDRNRMDLNNLSICIGPCLKLERWLFNYLVGDWRHCWQGCFTEKEYLEIEKQHEQGDSYQPPKILSTSNLTNDSSASTLHGGDERVVHSSGSERVDQREDSISTLSGDSMQRSRENSKPETYRPVGARGRNNDNVSTPQRSPTTGLIESKRPATAEDRKGSGDDTPTNSTPRPYTHSRSRSDVATTPVKGDFAFPPLPTRPA
ncbi:hypothetical protein LTR78_002636 [Recurvomyces mirabilis]|uniref:Rho-GAP domain-containing protein n=1 Tax=Recurvomyces mirabilis TaxID=574656 RepID=A0AAE0WU29_9PEZI|nr:hypothetical protein LTR78_002636 [Recurvomyces mirabilis]KAK5157565.1 hypothetical protein LTS14_004330 [Recurvomyces mirabilis]